METELEEYAERLYQNGCDGTDRSAEIYRRIFIEGAEWKAERMYSEEDLHKAYCAGSGYNIECLELNQQYYMFKEWLKQFKKK
jgi:hypothetical protein